MVTRRTNALELTAEAEAAWRDLIVAVISSRTPVPCTGAHAGLWTSDDTEERTAAAFRCEPCPITQRCSTYANTAGEKFHVWAGVDRTRRPATRKEEIA